MGVYEPINMKVLPLEGQPWVKTGREGRSTDHTKLNDETRCDIMKREKHQRACTLL